MCRRKKVAASGAGLFLGRELHLPGRKVHRSSGDILVCRGDSTTTLDFLPSTAGLTKRFPLLWYFGGAGPAGGLGRRERITRPRCAAAFERWLFKACAQPEARPLPPPLVLGGRAGWGAELEIRMIAEEADRFRLRPTIFETPIDRALVVFADSRDTREKLGRFPLVLGGRAGGGQS